MEFEARWNDLVSMFYESVETHGSRPLFGIKRDDGWSWTTYQEVGALVDAMRAGLATHGVERGDRVAIISNNRLEWFVGAFATYSLGAVYVPMYEHQLDKDWHYILNDCGARVALVANTAVQERVSKLQAELPELKALVNLDSDYEDLLAQGRAAPVDPIIPEPQDLSCMIYTSGTTGNPKGVRLTHINTSSMVSAITRVIPIAPDDRSLAFLPWAHLFGSGIEVNGLLSIGASIGICEDTTQLIGQLPEVRPTILFAVPRIWNRIHDGVQKQMRAKPAIIRSIFHAGMSAAGKEKRGQSKTLWEMIALPLAKALIFGKIKEKFGGRLRFAASGSAALSPDVAEFVDNLGIVVLEGYGMTEGSGCTTVNLVEERRIGSVGKALPGTKITLDHDVVGADAINGEIIIWGHGVMQGYHNLPEVTEATLTSDGGLRSGDLGRFDEDGFLFITGRVKEIYKLENGKYVAPAPLEEQLTLSPYIAQIMIYGANKRHNVALVVADQEGLTELGPQTPDQLKALLRAEIDKYSKEFKGFERVREFVILDEAFSMENGMLTPTLKIKRRIVVKEHGATLDGLYA
ncbi:MAG: long-chain acyl-CoA synthetase [Myxococcota bacterium]|jgi:long-chain acyl-CoA synthetase